MIVKVSARPRTALIMPVRNEEASVDETMESIFASTRLPDEIVIADGMSTDRTVEKLEKYRDRGLPLKIVSNPSLYAGGGRNAAIQATDADVLLLADFGNRLDQDWVRNMLLAFEENPDVDMVAGMYRPYIRSDFEHCVACIHYYEDYTLDRYSPSEREKLLPDEVLPGALSLALTREIWERCGGFPEWLEKGQDKMFSRKARALGATVAVAWDAAVEHHIRSTPGALFRQMLFYGRGNGQSRYLSRHAIKLSVFYLGVFACFLAGMIHWAGVIAGVSALIYYNWRAGIRRIVSVDHGLGKYKYLALAPAALISRDTGVMLGHLWGWMQWYFRPEFRELFETYTKGCPENGFPVLA